MSVSYRVGDKVRILSWDEMEEKFGKADEQGYIQDDNDDVFWDEFIDYTDTTATVVDVGVDSEGIGALKIKLDEFTYDFGWISPSFVQPLRPDDKDLPLNFEDIFR